MCHRSGSAGSNMNLVLVNGLGTGGEINHHGAHRLLSPDTLIASVHHCRTSVLLAIAPPSMVPKTPHEHISSPAGACLFNPIKTVIGNIWTQGSLRARQTLLDRLPVGDGGLQPAIPLPSRPCPFTLSPHDVFRGRRRKRNHVDGTKVLSSEYTFIRLPHQRQT